ncbi:MAG TPA: hypothetical protein VKE74_18380, partial [Gemmataceae bacterium]|nr:hypothetical protein [Gemmataceae bacterium]
MSPSIPDFAVLIACLCGVMAFMIVIFVLVRHFDSRRERSREPARPPEPAARPIIGPAVVRRLLVAVVLLAGIPLGIAAAASVDDGLREPKAPATVILIAVVWAAGVFGLMILVRLVRIILNIPVGSARTLPAPPASASDPRPVIGPTVVPQFFAGCGIVALILIGLLGLGFGILAWQRAEASAHPPSVWAYPALGLAGALYYYLFTLLLRVLRGPLAPADEPRPAPG